MCLKMRIRDPSGGDSGVDTASNLVGCSRCLPVAHGMHGRDHADLFDVIHVDHHLDLDVDHFDDQHLHLD